MEILDIANNLYFNRKPNNEEIFYLRKQLYNLKNNNIRILPNINNDMNILSLDHIMEINNIIGSGIQGLNITCTVIKNKCAINWNNRTISVDIQPDMIEKSTSTKNLHGMLLAIGNYTGLENIEKNINVCSTCISTILKLCTGNNTNTTEKSIIKDINKICIRNRIILYPRISRPHQNGWKEVTKEVNIRETNAWKFNPQIIKTIAEFFSLPNLTIDAFASAQNKQTDKYYSQWWETNTSGINFLEQNGTWENEFIWANPPFKPYSILNDTALFYKRRNIHGLLLIPKWTKREVWKTANNGCIGRIDIKANKNLYCSARDAYNSSAIKQKWGTSIFYYQPHNIEGTNEKFKISKYWKLNKDQKSFSIGSTNDK
jgi:hypothetical protein